MVEFFEVMNEFWNFPKFKKFTNNELNRNMFMINRRMAINFPIQSALLSINNINGAYVVRHWQFIITKQFKSLPKWIYTTSKKGDKKVKEYVPTNDLINMYCKINNCTPKDVFDCLKKFPDETKKEFKELEEMIKEM